MTGSVCHSVRAVLGSVCVSVCRLCWDNVCQGSVSAVSGPVTECQGDLSVSKSVCQGSVRAYQCQGSLSVS